MALTINYNGSPKEKPAPALKVAPKGKPAWDAIYAVTGSSPLLKKLYKQGIVSAFCDDQLTFATKNGILVHSIGLTLGDAATMSAATKGVPQLPPPTLKTLLNVAMNDALLKWAAMGTSVAAVAASPEIPTTTGTVPGGAAIPADPDAQQVEMATGKEPVVKLRNATKLYQLVNGSDTSSRYVVVAFTEDLKFAARLSSTLLSIRVEGPGLAKHATRLSAAGFSKFESDYASVHLKTMGDKVLAGKSLGAVLSGLAVQGIKITTPWPDVNQCEKGQ